VSRRRTQAVSSAGAIAIAVIAIYLGLRSRGSAHVEPVAAIVPAAREPASAASSPVESINRPATFQTLRLCASASQELAITNFLSDCKQYEGQPRFQDIYAKCLNGWMDVPNRKVAAQAALRDAGCGDTTDVQTRYFEATKQAAKAGDADAQMCYLQGEFATSSGRSLFTDAELQEYGQVAPNYVDAALRRGDWRIVELMTRRSFHPGVEPVRQIPDIGKPETIYKMTRLLRLGASGFYAESLDMELNGMIHPDLVPEAALPADVIKRGDAWAQQTFNEYFSGVAGMTERPTVCMAPLGEIDRLPGPSTP
jgi:hypothetical protein